MFLSGTKMPSQSHQRARYNTSFVHNEIFAEITAEVAPKCQKSVVNVKTQK